MTTTARKNITGTFTRNDLAKITAPIAWSGTTSQEDRDAAEADLAALRAECVDALDESNGHSVRIRRGQIKSVSV